ncbi:uncharacterized protein LOC142767905 [Rhipicephalus microplus]|uniref:uncharacterized protein LOC142767905 n=1 Tax=Rhipicephalus microplus TaxID=6941 RepID=UPI003F6D093C
MASGLSLMPLLIMIMMPLRSYSGIMIKHIGKVSALFEIGNRKACTEVFVVKKKHNTILHLDTSKTLGIVHRAVHSITTNATDKVVKDFSRLFQGAKCVPREYKIELHRNVVPVVQTDRTLLLSLRKLLRTEIDKVK